MPTHTGALCNPHIPHVGEVEVSNSGIFFFPMVSRTSYGRMREVKEEDFKNQTNLVFLFLSQITGLTS